LLSFLGKDPDPYLQGPITKPVIIFFCSFSWCLLFSYYLPTIFLHLLMLLFIVSLILGDLVPNLSMNVSQSCQSVSISQALTTGHIITEF